MRKSHENPYVQQVYKEFLGEPLSEKSHELLHTHYISRRDLIQVKKDSFTQPYPAWLSGFRIVFSGILR
ncbi:MAG: iron hydrogenase small subunit [Clostridium sp.]